MALRYVLDTEGFTFRVGRVAEPRFDKKTGEARIDKRSGLPQFSVQVIAEFPDGAEVLQVTISAESEPKLSKGQTVQVQGLEVVPWLKGEFNGPGKSLAVAWRAEKILPTAEKTAAK